MAASLSILLVLVIYNALMLKPSRMANGLEENSDKHNLIKIRGQLCSSNVLDCFELGYICDLSGPQEDYGRFLLKICKDTTYRNEYQALTKCLDGYGNLSVMIYCPRQVFSSLFNNDQTTCQSASIHFDCFRNLCPRWANVIDVFKNGFINGCSLGSFTYWYRIPTQEPSPTPFRLKWMKNRPVENVGNTATLTPTKSSDGRQDIHVISHGSTWKSGGNHLASIFAFVITACILSCICFAIFVEI